ncbi:AAA family ATPase [Thermogemmatispora sp.]|uniref:AAA family ATPase n=1 Tax=Thermogemmatispora sp. TaxID=1968838 RepID=UPI001DCF5C93|nr:AAA family ATPase [Thermogemmatispora sp.]MBX5451430.1 AAA family ATPase [Thermogemmatispora sp.]
MNSKVTYYRQYSFCGKPQCKKCREGRGHGPYWYAYRSEGGHATRTYIGRTLPPEALAQSEQQEIVAGLAGQSPLRRLYLLGSFRLERLTDALRATQRSGRPSLQPGGRALLALLICSPARQLSRHQALTTLWPDLAPSEAQRRLERAIANLRYWLVSSLSAALAAAAPSSNPALLQESEETLSLAGQQTLWIDADAFEEMLSRASECSDEPLRESLLDEAVRLYKGDLLAGWAVPPYPAQLATRREALRRSWRQALLTLVDLRLARDNLTGALPLLERLLAYNPSDEEALSQTMYCLAALRRRSEAIRLYQQFLSTHQGTPSEPLQTLYQAICANHPLSRPQPAPAPQLSQPAISRENLSTSSLPQIGRTHRSPLVGRDQELTLLRQLLITTEQLATTALEQLTSTATATGPTANRNGTTVTLPPVAQRQPQYAVLVAAPGLGKTRLAEELSREALQRQWTVIWSRVYEQESAIPYRLWIEPLRSITAQDFWFTQEIRQHPEVYAPLGAILPELYEILPPPPPLPPEQEQQRLKEALQELLTRVSRQVPLLLVLDDLHWADASSCELLGYLVRRLAGHPVLFIGTCRDSDLAANTVLQTLIAHLQREHGVIRLDLPPLTDEQIAQIVSHMPPVALRFIQAHAAGNPFFAEELARSIEMQLLSPSEGGFQANLQRLPETITAVLDMRLNRLSRHCRRLLSDAAILGGSFEFEALCALEASDPQPFDEERVLDLLDEALQAGVLTETSSGSHISYHFWHPLLASHLYESMSAMKRVLLHRRAAEILRQLYTGHEEKGAAMITYHLVAGGGSPEQIVHYASLAAEAAYALSAYTEAARLYRIAVEHFPQLSSSTTPANGRSVLPYDYRAYLLGRLAECIRIQGHYAEACQLYQRAFDVAQEGQAYSQDDPLYQTQLEARLLTEIGRTWFYMSDFARAHDYCDRAAARLRAAGVEGGMAWATLRYLRGYIYNDEGRYHEARQEGQEALRLFEALYARSFQTRTGDGLAISDPASTEERSAPQATRPATPLISGDPIGLARTHRFLSTLEINTGRHEQALYHLQVALQLAEELGHKREIAHICCNIGHVLLHRAAHQEALAYCRRSLELADEVGDLPLMAVVFSNLGILAERTGDLSSAERYLRQAIAQGEQGKDQVYVSYWNGYLASILQARGQLREAGQAIYQALTIGRAIKSSPCVSSALVALARLRLDQARLLQTSFSQEAAPASQPKEPEKQFQRLLQRARAALQLALAQPGITADVEAQGKTTLAEVTFLLGNHHHAQIQAQAILEQARTTDMITVQGEILALLARIFAHANTSEAITRAEHYFETALRIFQERGMRRHYARTLATYAQLLLQHLPRRQSEALNYQREAINILSECGATLDLLQLRRPPA